MNYETVNWNELESRAAAMTTEELHAAISEILRTLPYADAMDRETGSDKGGKYRDESSVYRRELRNRETRKTCRTCGGPIHR